MIKLLIFIILQVALPQFIPKEGLYNVGATIEETYDRPLQKPIYRSPSNPNKWRHEGWSSDSTGWYDGHTYNGDNSKKDRFLYNNSWYSMNGSWWPAGDSWSKLTDLEQSILIAAWNYFHPNETPPWEVNPPNYVPLETDGYSIIYMFLLLTLFTIYANYNKKNVTRIPRGSPRRL